MHRQSARNAPRYQTLLTCLATFCVLTASCNGKEDVEPPIVRPVLVQALEAGTAQDARSWLGAVEARRNAELAFGTGGRIASILVREGQTVRAGQVLATLDAADTKLRISEAQAQLTQLEADLARRTAMLDERVISPAELERARADTEVSRAAVAQLQLEQDRMVLRASSDSIVGRIIAAPGAAVAGGQSVISLVDRDMFDVVVSVSEDDALDQRLQPGRSFPAWSAARPDLRLALELVEREAAAAETARTWRLRLRGVQPQGALLLPGMSVRVTAPGPVSPAKELTVPLASLVDVPAKDGSSVGKIVWIAPRGATKVRAVPVKVVRILGSEAAVAGDIPRDARLVVAGARFIRAGQPVRLVERR